MKDGKATGGDGIPNEVWKYGGEEVLDWAWRYVQNLERRGVVGGLEGRDNSTNKEKRRWDKGNGLQRGDTNAHAIQDIRDGADGKAKGRGGRKGNTTGKSDRIQERDGDDGQYIRTKLFGEQADKEGSGKMVAFFIDLRAAFDSVDRGVLLEAMRKRGVREGLRKRVKEILKETRSRVRTGDGISEPFWTVRGVRQGCPLSPLLYNILTADMEEKMSKSGGGGIKMGGRKIYTLAYADDVVVLAEEEADMRALLERLERYLDEKRLETEPGQIKNNEIQERSRKMEKERAGGGRERK
ncbi:uncharacterized protein LOC123989135 [Osmia bicornis bicornis]|uniref:uncharacterized protein LOC123989135 n=1 Tax=Osmia bicornis bicornis TaxID=1437191 RepID=UPI001EAEE93F|nr:uncharacterized protein LOC123989135 [Osmia bicornis bicornis]